MIRRTLLPAIALLVAFAAPTGASAALSGEERDNVFRVTGDAADDRVSATANGTAIAFDFEANGTIDKQVEMADIDSVVIELGAGTDSFSAIGNLSTEQWAVNGGSGPDQLLGTNGVDSLVGGSGGDLIDGQQANDTVAGGTGADTIRWDPGDGSETIDGGGDADLDTLEFNGSNIDEVFTVSAEGTRVRFTRNIATITMLLDRVDVIDLESFGGADNLTAAGVGALTNLRIDSGAGADTIATGNGHDRIVGGSEADNIDAGAGDDRIFGGDGPDSAFGRDGDDGIAGGEGVDGINGGANLDGCTEAGDIISDCESATLPADIVPRPFEHPLEPEETPPDPGPVDPGPTDPGPIDPEPTDPVVEGPPPVAGFAIDRVTAGRRGLRVAIDGTAADAVEVEIEASEVVKRDGRSGRRTVRYAPVTRAVAAGERTTVRLKAPRRHLATLAEASKRKVITKVTNVTNGLSETEETRSSR